jgi:hypothetical protein
VLLNYINAHAAQARLVQPLQDDNAQLGPSCASGRRKVNYINAHAAQARLVQPLQDDNAQLGPSCASGRLKVNYINAHAAQARLVLAAAGRQRTARQFNVPNRIFERERSLSA